MATERQNRIAEMLSGLCDREFTGFEISVIANCVNKEFELRKDQGIKINSKTKLGKQTIRQDIADLVNKTMDLKHPITANHIHKYKIVLYDEYTERTGKCAYGYKDLRARWGYDPDTALEIGGE